MSVEDLKNQKSYNAAMAVDLWILEGKARESGRTDLADEIKSHREFSEGQAKRYEGEIQQEKDCQELNKPWWNSMS
jgi:hypothetical protein